MRANFFRLKNLALAVLLPAFFVSCTKQGNLGGPSVPNSGTSATLSGSVAGGLSPVTGATVNLQLAGGTSLATATTSSTGAYTLSFTNPGGTGLLYISVTGGNAGGGSNSNSTMYALVGLPGNVPSTIAINEMTTAAFGDMMFAFGFTNASGGFNAPPNAAGSTNALTQYNGLVASGKVNGNLVAASQIKVSTIADSLAYCVETPGNCSTLFATAANSSGSPATSMTNAIANMLTIAADTTPVYNLAFPLAPTTGFAISSAPSGSSSLSFVMPATSQSGIPVGSAPFGIAIDTSGNIWVGNSGGNSITELNSSGNNVTTITSVPGPQQDLAIDQGNNIWTPSGNNVIEVSAAGSIVGTFGVGTTARGVAIDPSGNIWVANNGSNNVTELTQSGTVVGTFNLNNGPTPGTGPMGIAIDASNNVWVQCLTSANVLKLNSSGVIVGTTALGSTPTSGGIAIDSSGNVWVNSLNTVTKINGGSGSIMNTATATSAGQIAIDKAGNTWVGSTTTTITEIINSGSNASVLGTYTGGATNRGIAIDASGNVWTTQSGGSTVFQLQAVTSGNEFYPYTTGPMVPSSY